ncbi:imidazole glycerol phosphate synthase subunit HisH [Methylomonas sp. SURF-2]|uniref:Imidazole glycerol phosphate synthase subunit HisH n=1 Tax=Methylomonas subterranea TaxID=2952225 RepID=A0ABT1TIX7_9GAMM|nr:imidazole glycerol phosphate synthase subunit HisH [Methylomonas sp. SURF-2]MCQ8105426.1 imidazole glycerol phosphate synthase subunit HisH [Methylomonas sp. SURF-2]
MSSVAVIDYGMGNLHSIAKALQHAEPEVRVLISADAATIQNADRVVFPGVGAIRDCMQALHALNLMEVIMRAAREKPFLGVCLGMQALLTDSEENGGINCLNLFPGHVRRFSDGLCDQHGGVLKVPHMGWNRVKQKKHPLWHNIAQDSRFYFVHSYFVTPDREEDGIATSDYPEPFTCALARDNMFAVQFHPEKSQAVGLQLLQNFLRWDGAA